MFGHRVGKIIRKLAFWFPPAEGHRDEGYLFVPEGKPAPLAAARPAGKTSDGAPAARTPASRVLPAHNVLLIGAAGSREIGLALRETGMKVTTEEDLLRAEKLLRRVTFDAMIVDMDINERGLMSLTRILRRSDSKKALFILLAQNVGSAEREIANRIGADAVWLKAGLQATILGNFEAVSADRTARNPMAPPARP